MATLITYNKVVENEGGQFELERITLAGIAQEGIVLDAGMLNNELADAVQYFYNMGWRNKLDSANKALEKYSNRIEYSSDRLHELENDVEYYSDICDLLNECTAPALSKYTFINRIALAILNTKKYRINGEIALYNALKISGAGDSAQLNDLSDTRKTITPILASMLEVKECPYLKPVNIKLNLREVSQLVAIANNTRTRWTVKGIKTKYSKTIETEVAIQSILFVCRNAFNMVIPVTTGKDTRETI